MLLLPVQRIKAMLPAWADPWFDLIVVGAQVALIIVVALLLRALLHLSLIHI